MNIVSQEDLVIQEELIYECVEKGANLNKSLNDLPVFKYMQLDDTKSYVLLSDKTIDYL